MFLFPLFFSSDVIYVHGFIILKMNLPEALFLKT